MWGHVLKERRVVADLLVQQVFSLSEKSPLAAAHSEASGEIQLQLGEVVGFAFSRRGVLLLEILAEQQAGGPRTVVEANRSADPQRRNPLQVFVGVFVGRPDIVRQQT